MDKQGVLSISFPSEMEIDDNEKPKNLWRKHYYPRPNFNHVLFAGLNHELVTS